MRSHDRSAGARLTRRVVEPTSQRSLSARLRERRWNRLLAAFPDLPELRVLDLGGTPMFWASVPERPVSVTVLNLGRYTSQHPAVTCVSGDACEPPAEVTARTYDLVLSNSVLEHVGGHAQRQKLADVVRRSAPRHWVQTPYRYFPLEPHWLFPGLQFLPFAARVRATQAWPLGHRQTDDRAVAVASVHEVELIGRTQMRSYFPDSAIEFERVAGVPKSLIALRTTA